jgi:hypothetical protein
VTETVVWVDADGGQTTLEVETGMAAVSNRFMPPVQHAEDVVAGQPGARLRASRHDVHEMVIPFWFVAASDSALRTMIRSVIDLMDPIRGPGKLRVTSPLGDQREITCVYSDGLGLDERLGESSGASSQLAPAAFRAHDPYWYDVSPITNDYQVTSTPSFFPIFPMRLTASELVVDATIVNDGSVETWPQWTIYGPGSAIALRNLTTGKNLLMSTATLTTGQAITIDTRRDYKSVLQDDGTNLWPLVDLGSSLWPLARGTNRVRLEMAGVTAGVSRLSLSYKRAFLSP